MNDNSRRPISTVSKPGVRTAPTGAPNWFRQKAFGYGSGLPIAWQGWAVIAAYIATLAAIGQLTRVEHGFARAIGFALFIGATIAFLWLCRRHTAGGWRWRWGTSDEA